MANDTRHKKIAELQALEETVTEQLAGVVAGERHTQLVTAKALLSIASSLASLDTYGITTMST
ncbi:hypothetical protein ABH924_003747 [Arthrobacter sp. GAS37]|uniref:hypothetical protein n=1 Tax=Arthrobacter sp. GAS37 TaxID=3156261 RepID=UPI003838BAF6